MSQLTMNTPQTTLPLPLAQRIPLRALAFLAVLLVLVGYPLYLFLDLQLSGGIKDSSDARGEIKVADLKTISDFKLNPMLATDDDIPARFRALDGQRVQLIGEMYVTKQAAGPLREFDLVYSISKCCVGPDPQIQHFIKSTVPGGSVNYRSNLVKAKGILRVGIVRNEVGGIDSVYRFEVESVEKG